MQFQSAFKKMALWIKKIEIYTPNYLNKEYLQSNQIKKNIFLNYID